jgi:hypothetical protein
MFYPSIYLSATLQIREKKEREGGASIFVELTQMWPHIRSYLVL